MNGMLPSKKILALLIIVVAAGGAGLLIYIKNLPSSNSSVGLAAITPSNTAATPALLPNFPQSTDWQAALKSTATTTVTQDNTPQTATDAFAQDFFTQYMNAQNSGTKVTPDNASQFASSYLNSTSLPSIQATQYTEANLTEITTDQDSLKNYQTQLNTILNQYWPSGNNTELSILQDAFTNNNQSALTKLNPIITAYNQIINKVLGLKTPRLASSLTLNALNSLSTYVKTLQTIEVAFKDPINGLAGINAFETSAAAASTNFNNLEVYLTQNAKK